MPAPRPLSHFELPFAFRRNYIANSLIRTGEQVVEYAESKMAEGKFYIICPDNDVSEEMDKKRMLWDRLDLVEGRPPLTRWREDYESEAKEAMAKMKI